MRGPGVDPAWEREVTRMAGHRDGRTVDALAPAADEGRGHAAKCPGEALAAGDPGVSEWGNLRGGDLTHPGGMSGGAPGELKHLSTRRNREHALSSGERTGHSPNPTGERSLPALPVGGWTGGPEGAAAPSQATVEEPNASGTGGRRG